MIKFVLILTVIFSFPFNSSAQWMPTSGPEGGGGFGIVEHGGKLFASTLNGIYFSDNNGALWKQSGLAGRQIYRILSSENSIFSSVDDSLFRSIDTGKTWIKIWVAEGLRIQSIVKQQNDIFLSVADIYGSGQNSGIYKSIDEGLTWSKVASSSDFSFVRTLLVTGSQNIIAVTFSKGILVSSNAGSTWSKAAIHTFETPILWTARSFNGKLFAAGENAIFLTSTDLGKTWDSSACEGILSYDAIYDIQPITSEKIIAIRYYSDTVYQTTNRGKTWSPLLSNTLPTNAYGTSSKTSLSFIGSSLYCQSEIGIFKTDASVIDWEYKGSGILNANVNSLTFYDGTLYASSLSGVFHSSDNGATWVYPIDSSQLRWRSIGRLHSTLHEIYAAGEEGVWRHEGNIWRSIDSSFTYDISSSGDTVVWATGTSGLLYTTDNGVNVQHCGNQLLQGDTTAVFNIFATGSAFIAHVGFLTYDPSGGYYYYVPRLYRSGDGMQSWYMVDSGIVGDYLLFAKFGDDIFAGSANGYGLSKSTNDGLTWEHVPSISSNAYISALSVIGGSIFLSIEGDSLLSDGIYYSIDGGEKWKFTGEGVLTAFCLASSNDFLYAGISNQGVWRMPLGQFGIKQNESNVLEDYWLFPNPASKLISVIGDISKLAIYTLLGEKVFEKETNSSDQIELPSLPTGIYFAEMKGKTTKIEKLIIK